MQLQQFKGVPFDGIIHQKPQRISDTNRGIIFDRPERFVVNTPVGQVEIYDGDWLVEFLPGSTYVIRDRDITGLYQPPKKKWWQIWA